jgi:hypothetical protein
MRIGEKIFIGVILFLVILSFSASAFSHSHNLKATRRCARNCVYHTSECRHNRAILPSNSITFDTPEEAQAAGYRPCFVCEPPIHSVKGK